VRVATWPPGGIVGALTNFGMRPAASADVGTLESLALQEHFSTQKRADASPDTMACSLFHSRAEVLATVNISFEIYL